MFDNLIESKRKKAGRRTFGVGAASLVIHTVVIAGAVYATLQAGQTDNSVKVDTAMVFVDQPKQEKPPEQQPVQLDVPLKGFQTVVAPDVIPTNIDVSPQMKDKFASFYTALFDRTVEAHT